MVIDRRTVLTWLGTAAGFGSSANLLAASTLKVGEIEVLSVSDGNLVLPSSFYFDGLPEAKIAEILRQHGITSPQLEPPCNVTVMRDGTRTVLFDAGSGSTFMPSAGTLVANLDAIGITPMEITHVVFTHAHPDHIWGVLDDFDDPVFAEAAYMIGQAEWDYWRDSETVTSIGHARASLAVGAQRRLRAIEDRCSLFSGGQEILPNVMTHASFGHTPGHMAFEIRTGRDALLVGGDAISNHHVAFVRPDWPNGSDQDPLTAAITRSRLLDMLSHENIPLLGFHLPGGGLGRVERDNDSYRFDPETE